MKKIIKWTAIILGGLFVLIAVAGAVLYSNGVKKLNQTYPNLAVETIDIPTDADAVVRGKHVATIWACTRCHGEDLSGMVLVNDPLSGLVPLSGTVVASNLTSGMGGVSSAYTDADWVRAIRHGVMDWVRAIRHGVMPDGHIEALMFDYSTMSDPDLGDLIAYLKQVPPVDTDYPEMSYGPIVPVVTNLELLTPAAERIDHNAARPTGSTPGATAEYGGYLSAICVSCHGSSVGSTVENWNQDDFIHTFQSGVLPNGKPFGPTMSSNIFREMTAEELTALWLHFTNTHP